MRAMFLSVLAVAAVGAGAWSVSRLGAEETVAPAIQLEGELPLSTMTGVGAAGRMHIRT